MTNTSTNDFLYEQGNVPVDAAFIDGFDVEDDEDRWAGRTVTTAPPRRNSQFKRVQARRR